MNRSPTRLAATAEAGLVLASVAGAAARETIIRSTQRRPIAAAETMRANLDGADVQAGPPEDRRLGPASASAAQVSGQRRPAVPSPSRRRSPR